MQQVANNRLVVLRREQGLEATPAGWLLAPAVGNYADEGKQKAGVVHEYLLVVQWYDVYVRILVYRAWAISVYSQLSF
jgi:hypothetical protein